MELVDIFGYAAMCTVVLSFIMKNLVALRLVNIVGCSFFVIYGFMLPGIAWPIIITNLAIIAVNGFYLGKHFKK